jgi:endonuclease I
MPFRRLFAASVTLLVFAGCAEMRTPVDPDLGLPASAESRGRILAGDTSSILVYATRTGTATVRVCAPEGMSFALIHEDSVSTGASCETLMLPVERGESYRVRVRAVQGEGHYNACFSLSAAGCTVSSPYPYPYSVPVGYYDLAEGKTGAALRLALHQIISSGHRLFDYTTARDSLYSVVDDPFDRDTISDIFVGRPAAVTSRATAVTAGFNAEHSWPQSRGAGQAPAESDLHILFSADETGNGQRSNHPWGVVATGVTWESSNPGDTAGVSKVGTSSGGQTVMEVRDPRKGDVARAMHYFYIRYYYDRTSSFSLQNFNLERPTLVQWHAADPPGSYERARHDRVFRVQRNRNPFIDRPEWLVDVGVLPES